MPNTPLAPPPSPRALRAMAAERGVAPRNGHVWNDDGSMRCTLCGQEPCACGRERPATATNGAEPTPTAAALTFILPLPPNQNREQGHWSARHRRKMAYFRLCDSWAHMPGFVPPPPRVPFDRVTVSATMRMWAPMDPDNAKYRASKWPLDYLKTRGYIVNDTAKVVRWTGDPEQVIERKRETGNRLILMITVEAACP